MSETDARSLFHPLTREDRFLYETYYQRTKPLISDLTFASRISWNEAFQYHVAEIEDSLVLTAQTHVFTGLHFSMPLGLSSPAQLRRVVASLWDPYAKLSLEIARLNRHQDHSCFMCFEKEDRPFLRFLYFCEKEAKWMRTLEDQYEICEIKRPEYSDYIYAREALAQLKGKKLRTRRNHFNAFEKHYPHYQFRPMQEKDFDAVIALSKHWSLQKGLDPKDPFSGDHRAILHYLEHYPDPWMKAAVLYLGEELLAFCMGYEFETMAFTHFEKAREEVTGAYAAINRLAAQFLYKAPWINREEDMGDEGLKRAKEAYAPERQQEKIEFVLFEKRTR